MIKGPGNDVWVIDHHHTLAALDYSPYHSTAVTLHLVCDYSNLTSVTAFWKLMVERRAVYNYGRPHGEPNRLPAEISTTALPVFLYFNKTGSTFLDDPWRSLAGFIRKIKSVWSKEDRYFMRQEP